MHRRAMLGRIDHRAGEHAAAEIVQTGGIREPEQRIERRVVDRGFVEIQHQIVRRRAEPGGPVRIGGE
jgi:hypothetical protein